MAEISNPPAGGQKQNGFVLLIAIITMSILLILGIYVVSFTTTEFKISSSQATATQAYYLAESGVAEAIWHLKNDNSWKTNFETNPTWNFSYTRNAALYSNGSYTVQITNSGLAKAQIISTGKITSSNGTAQRVIKSSVYKAMGDSVLSDNAGYADGDINISLANLNIHNGSLFSNLNVIVNGGSTINVDDAVRAGNNIVKNNNSTINAIVKQEHATNLPMPAISFDSASDPNSYKAKANHVYTSAQFASLLENNHNLTLTDPITYVTGDITTKYYENLTINGLLVADGKVDLGKIDLCIFGTRSKVTINQPSSSSPSGLLAKGRINFDLCLSDFDAHGLVYANDQINVLSLPKSFTLHGGLVSRKLTMTSIWQGLNITTETSTINNVIGSHTFSPVINVDHWEEEY